MAAVSALARVGAAALLRLGTATGMEETQGQPGAEDTTTAALGAEATDATTVETADASLEVTDTGAEASDGDTAISEADAADAADLAQYPESVREDFKALAPEKRKALYEEAEKRAEARITENRQRLDKLEADRKAQEARRAEIRARTGKHVGAEAQTITLPNGNEIELPSRDEMENLSKTQRGRDELRTKYGLDEDNTEFWCFVLDRNREALDASADLLDDAAWGKLDVNLRDGIKAELGIDPNTILSGAQSPREVIKGVADHFRGQIAQLKKEHEARTTALNANAEGMRGQVVAATSRELPTGGRSAGAASHIFTREELSRMDVPTYRQNKAEIERQDRAGLIR